VQRPPRAVRPGRTEVARAAGARVASVRRAARPRIALVPMLHRRGGDEAFAVVDDGFLLSTLPDGWRCLALLDDRVRLRSRAGRDLAPSLPGIATALAKLCPPRGAGPTILDGIVILPSAGERPSPTLADVLAFAVLDVLCVAGRDVTGRALRERQELLRGLSWSRDGAVRFEPAWRGDARAGLAQLDSAGTLASGALLARRAASRYRPGLRAADWISFGEPAGAEMLLCGIASSGALVLGMPTPPGIVLGGVTWPTRRWSALAERCREGPALFATDALWPSLGPVAWTCPELWLRVAPDVRPGSGRGGPRWRFGRVQEDLSLPAVTGDAGTDVATELW